MFLIGLSTTVKVNGQDMTAIETLDYTPTLPVAHIVDHVKSVVDKQKQERPDDVLTSVKQLVNRDKLEKETSTGED